MKPIKAEKHHQDYNFQPELRPELPCVYGAKDYREFRATLVEMDQILVHSGVEHRSIIRQINALGTKLSGRRFQTHYQTLKKALRYSILLALTGNSYRKLSCMAADSHLFQWFTGAIQVDGIRPLSKSSIERLEKMYPSEEITQLIHELNAAMTDQKAVEALLYRETALKMDQIFADTTCVKTNIHFPVDWLLLRDATLTLIQAIILIRKHGLKHRIRKPESFIREMNKLCIEMTHTRKKKHAGKMRKTVLRRMKRLMKTIEAHALSYHRELKAHREETDWTAIEAQHVLDKMDGILKQLHQAIEQAHERIIGGRKVPIKKKILSLYETDTRVIVRGKAGAEVEFGNALYLAEQADGLIVDWTFIKEQPPSDTKLVEESLNRIENAHGKPTCYVADRGFDAATTRDQLEERNITNAICPRSVARLREQLEDETFCLLQKRRGQTEGRIGIFKNAYLGKPLRSKGFTNRRTRIEWCVLTHNLWKLAKMAAQAKEQQLAEAA